MPLISPNSSTNHSDSAPVDGKKQRESPPPAPNNSSSNLDSKGLNNSSSGSSHNVSEAGNGKPLDTNKGNRTEGGLQSSNREICDGVPDNKKCRDQKKLVACIQSNIIGKYELLFDLIHFLSLIFTMLFRFLPAWIMIPISTLLGFYASRIVLPPELSLVKFVLVVDWCLFVCISAWSYNFLILSLEFGIGQLCGSKVPSSAA